MPVSNEIVEKIKKLKGDYKTGSALLDMMEYYKVNCLWDITEEQAENYYKMMEEKK